jgi:hypothetical protein
MVDAAAFLVNGLIAGITAVSIGTVLKPLLDSWGDHKE